MAPEEVKTAEGGAAEESDASFNDMMDRIETDNNVDRGVLTQRLKELDGKIKEIEAKIAEEKAKPEPNNLKLATLNDRLARVQETRDRVHGKYETLYGKLDAKADKVDEKLKKIRDLEVKIKEMDAKASALEASGDPAKGREAAAIRREMSELQDELKVLTLGDRKERLEAKSKALREAEAATKAEEKERLTALEKEILEGEEKQENPSEEDSDKKSEEEITLTDEEEALAKKQELLHNALHKVSYGLAVDLERNYPGEEANAFDKMSWGGKAMLCKLLVMMGGTPQWVELLNPTQKEFMEKKMGMKIGEEKNKKGETVPVITWVDPVEGWEPVPPGMETVFDHVYTSTEKQEIYKKINAQTTLKDLIALAPESDTSESAQKTRQLIAALQESGLKPEDEETKVQAYLGKNARKVMDFLGAPNTTEEPTQAAPEAPAAKPPETAA